ncbi:Dynamin related protein 4C [Perilla frutescens var. frutescens]|nr:Dynamin related protein 4C [Perilla frutescens var. frutescens]
MDGRIWRCGHWSSEEPGGCSSRSVRPQMGLTDYWKIVLRRMVDCLALHLLFSVQNLVSKEMETEIISEIGKGEGRGFEKMLEESSSCSC